MFVAQTKDFTLINLCIMYYVFLNLTNDIAVLLLANFIPFSRFAEKDDVFGNDTLHDHLQKCTIWFCNWYPLPVFEMRFTVVNHVDDIVHGPGLFLRIGCPEYHINHSLFYQKPVIIWTNDG